MRIALMLVSAVCLLSACSGSTPATATPFPTVPPSPNFVQAHPAEATQTRVAELSILATAAAPTTTPTATVRPLPIAPATPTLAALKWNDLPIPPNSQGPVTSRGGVTYTVPGSDLSVSAFMEREWKALGLKFAFNTLSNGLNFYTYSYPNDPKHMVSYGVERIDGSNSRLYLLESR